jgi:hypothetical protein
MAPGFTYRHPTGSVNGVASGTVSDDGEKPVEEKQSAESVFKAAAEAWPRLTRWQRLTLSLKLIAGSAIGLLVLAAIPLLACGALVACAGFAMRLFLVCAGLQ